MMDAKQTPRALALVGMPGAGKTMCAKHLEQRGFFQFRFGGIVVNEVARRGLPLNPENERLVREDLRAQDGMTAIAKRALPHLHKALQEHSSIIMDGLYSFSEYKMLRAEFGDDMIVVAIVAPRSLRYQRLSQRTERPLSAQQAEARDYQEIENIEKGGPIAIADYTLINDGEPEALIQQLDDLLQTLHISAE